MDNEDRPMNKLTAAFLLLLTLLVGQAFAQSELGWMAGKLVDVLKTERPEWHCEQGEPMLGSSDVKVVHCHFSRRILTLALYSFDSVADAERWLLKGTGNDRQRRRLSGIGDEAYRWFLDEPNLTLRKGKFGASVAAVVFEDAFPDWGTLSNDEKSARMKAEHASLVKESTQYVLTAMGP
jgi:hypothetical protein